MHQAKKPCALKKAAVALMAGMILASAKGDYTFIISGWPAVNNSSSLSSQATSLETSTCSEASEGKGLEARFRSWLESIGTALKSTRFFGFYIDVR